MHERLGRALHFAKEFVARFRRTPFERLQHGQMSIRKIERMGGAIMRRLEAAHLVTKDLPPLEPHSTDPQRLQKILGALRESDIQVKSNPEK